MFEKTFAMIKPDAVERGLTGKIIDRIEQEGFTIVAMRKKRFTRETAEEFYGEHKGKGFFEEMLGQITSGPCVFMILAKENAIKDWRTLMGATNPDEAEENTIRKLYAKSMGENSVHGSDSLESAERELGMMFPGAESNS